MRRATFCASLVVFAAVTALADEPRMAGNLPVTPTAIQSGQKVDLRPRGSAANRWRYSFQNGHWWYYRDGGRWAYWNGEQWRDYQPTEYRRWYAKQEMDALNANLAQFDARTMAPYMSGSYLRGLGGGPVILGNPGSSFAAPSLPSSDGALQIFTPRAYDGRLNPATSVGGYMGGALRGPFGY